MVQAALTAFPPDFRHDGRVAIDLRVPSAPRPAPPPTEIHDARARQGDQDPAAFFARHGFTLLRHETAITDWDAPPPSRCPPGYLDELETLIRTRLLPGRRIEIPPVASLVRRGRDTTTPAYGTGVHQDCGLGVDDYQQLVGAFAGDQAAAWWRAGYDRAEVESYLLIDFWRTTNMDEPLRHMPLALCDPNSVDPADIVPTEIHGIAPDGRAPHQMALRRNPEQRWYSYPGMTGDEVLAFKLFEARKSDPEPRLRACFHSAFADPAAPADAQPRQSCECRVGVFVMR